MRVFNRVLVVLMSVAVVALAIALMVAPYRVVDGLRSSLGLFRENLSDGTYWAVTVLILVVLTLLALLIIVLQFWPRPQKTVRIYAQGRGNARLKVESVAQTLEYRIDELPGVLRVEPRLVSRGKDLLVTLDVDAGPGVNIPALSDQIIDRALRVLEGELGLQVRGRIRLDISHEPSLPGEVPSERRVGAPSMPVGAGVAATPVDAEAGAERRAWAPEPPRAQPEPQPAESVPMPEEPVGEESAAPEAPQAAEEEPVTGERAEPSTYSEGVETDIHHALSGSATEGRVYDDLPADEEQPEAEQADDAQDDEEDDQPSHEPGAYTW